MSTILAVLVDGVIYASWLFIIAAGLTTIYGVMRILNMAHGSLYALGAYAAASLAGAWLRAGWEPMGSYAMLVLAALLVGLVVGPLIERGLLVTQGESQAALTRLIPAPSAGKSRLSQRPAAKSGAPAS